MISPLPNKTFLIAFLIMRWFRVSFNGFPFSWRTSFWLVTFIVFLFKLLNFVKIKFGLISIMMFVSRIQRASTASSTWGCLKVWLMQQTCVSSVKDRIGSLWQSKKQNMFFFNAWRFLGNRFRKNWLLWRCNTEGNFIVLFCCFRKDWSVCWGLVVLVWRAFADKYFTWLWHAARIN